MSHLISLTIVWCIWLEDSNIIFNGKIVISRDSKNKNLVFSDLWPNRSLHFVGELLFVVM